ncbi:DUF6234 family protein [Streptomyces sp. 4N509B]|uniref:DUF6234 family protein n=1 Tax=Streptomyces sp. 4N509B TaxID=3457413 RepID=UPI003FD119D4
MVSPPPTRPSQERVRWAVDLVLVVGMILVDVIAVAAVLVFAIGLGLDEALDPSGASESGGTGMDRVAVIGFGGLALFAALTCALLIRRAPVSGVLQGLVATACALLALFALASREDATGPDPTSPSVSDTDTDTDELPEDYGHYDGTGGGPCRSGGGNDECVGSSG